MERNRKNTCGCGGKILRHESEEIKLEPLKKFGYATVVKTLTWYACEKCNEVFEIETGSREISKTFRIK